MRKTSAKRRARSKARPGEAGGQEKGRAVKARNWARRQAPQERERRKRSREAVQKKKRERGERSRGAKCG